MPLRVLKYELREANAGHGKWRGGLGTVRLFEFLDDGAISIEGDGHKYEPWGFDGGTDGSTAEINLIEKSNNKASLPSKIPYKTIAVGTKIEVMGPNGGGYGAKSERDPELIRSDLENEIITEKIAKEEYDLTF